MKRVIITEEAMGKLMLLSVFNELLKDVVYRSLFSNINIQGELNKFIPIYLGNHGHNDDKNIDIRDLANKFLSSIYETLPGVNISDAGGVSPVGVSLISKFETGKNFGYQMSRKDLVGYDLGDAKGKKTYGYGLLYHPTKNAFMEDVKEVWTQQELEQLFIQTIANMAKAVKRWMLENNVKLGQNQFDAMVSACYNFGANGFLNKYICQIIAANPNDSRIPVMWMNLSNKQGMRYPGLLKRRATEAELYKKDMKTKI